MRIDLLFVEDCPNRGLARANLDAALAQLGLGDVVVEERQVDTDDDARRHGMHGSPTILVDGRDPFAASDVEASLSCRLYATSDGMRGAPPVADVAAALRTRA